MKAKEMFSLAQKAAEEARASRARLKEQRLEKVLPLIQDAAQKGQFTARIVGQPDPLLTEVLVHEGFKITPGNSYDQRDNSGEAWIDISWGHLQDPVRR